MLSPGEIWGIRRGLHMKSDFLRMVDYIFNALEVIVDQDCVAQAKGITSMQMSMTHYQGSQRPVLPSIHAASHRIVRTVSIRQII
jgi:hypothetical protein